MALLELLIGLLLLPVGLCIFGIFAICLYELTIGISEVHWGTLSGQFWKTYGQELFALLMLLGWSIVVFGCLLITWVPGNWSLITLLACAAAPPGTLWVVAKLYSIRATITMMESKLFLLIYGCIMVWAGLKCVGVATFMPTSPISTYYGHVTSPVTLTMRVGETIIATDIYRRYRADVSGARDPRALLRSLRTAENWVDEWHGRRAAWGGERLTSAADYRDQVLCFMKTRWLMDWVDYDALRFRESRLLAALLMDRWWGDVPLRPPGPSDEAFTEGAVQQSPQTHAASAGPVALALALSGAALGVLVGLMGFWGVSRLLKGLGVMYPAGRQTAD